MQQGQQCGEKPMQQGSVSELKRFSALVTSISCKTTLTVIVGQRKANRLRAHRPVHVHRLLKRRGQGPSLGVGPPVPNERLLTLNSEPGIAASD
ncbi:hypothetical protein CDD83_8718 [Cordyceps sp. RAO-2017]|nr:hypothetical protein CDD83_8718 [Cordyceps sp. RAO-2017]